MLLFECDNEGATEGELDMVLPADPSTPEGAEKIAQDVENACKETALEAVQFFENGEDAVKSYMESAEVQGLLEARKMSRKTFVRLGKSDDLTRRRNMACLIIAREKGDPLFKQLADNRKKEKKLRNAIYNRYKNQAERIAKISQKKHIKDMKTMKALPKITLH